VSQPFQMVRQKGGTIMGTSQIATQAGHLYPRSVPTVMLRGDPPERSANTASISGSITW
jgi:hypothetical protein